MHLRLYACIKTLINQGLLRFFISQQQFTYVPGFAATAVAIVFLQTDPSPNPK